MSTTLTPHGLIAPDDGDSVTNLQDAIVTNAQKLRNAVLYSAGPINARPDPGIVGREYRSTDEGRHYKDIGSAWVRIDAPRPSTGAATTDEALRKLGTAAGEALPGNHPTVPVDVDELPDDPVDGQEIYLALTSSVTWRLRYDAATEDWLAVSPAPWCVDVAGAEDFTGDPVTWHNLSGPSITLPAGIGGTFVVDVNVAMIIANFLGGGWVGEAALYVNSTQVELYEIPDVETYRRVSRRRPLTIAAGATVRLRYRSNNGSGFNTHRVKQRSLTLTPLRIG